MMQQRWVIPIIFAGAAVWFGTGTAGSGTAAAAGAPAAANGPITVEEVVRLVRAGVGDDLIIQQIRLKGAPPAISTDQIIALKNAQVSERVIRALLEPGTAPGPPARATPQGGGWTSHVDPMGFAVSQPPGWKVTTEPALGRASVQGTKGERVIIWPMFLEKRQLDERTGGIMVRQLAARVDGQLPWSAPRFWGRYVVTAARTAQRKSTAMLSWANSQSGSTIVLYSVAAPADIYASSTEIFASVLRSFRITEAAAGTGGGTGRRPPVSAQFVRWTDPMENAFSVSAPQGWKVIGGMYRFGTTDSRPEVTLFCPGGGLLIKLGQKDFGAFMEPIRSPMGGMQSGSLPMGDGSSIQIQSYLSGQQFARYYAEHARQECSGVRVVAGNSRTDLAASMSHNAQAEGVPAGQLTAGDVTFTCTAQGTELRGYYLAATMRIETDAARRGMGGAMWFVYRLGGYLAIPEWQQTAEEIAQQVVRSLQVNPEWRARTRAASQALVTADNARSQALRSRAYAAMAENQRQTSDLISRSYWAQQARYDEISRKRENGILGTVDVVDPATGYQYKVEYNANYYWMNDQGYMAGTLAHDAPGTGWQEMMQLP